MKMRRARDSPPSDMVIKAPRNRGSNLQPARSTYAKGVSGLPPFSLSLRLASLSAPQRPYQILTFSYRPDAIFRFEDQLIKNEKYVLRACVLSNEFSNKAPLPMQRALSRKHSPFPTAVAQFFAPHDAVKTLLISESHAATGKRAENENPRRVSRGNACEGRFLIGGRAN